MSSDNVAALPLRGKTMFEGKTIATADIGQSAKIEGACKRFDDYLPGNTSGARTTRSNRMVTCLLVRNVAAAALTPKRAVSWAAGFRGKRVDGYCDVSYEECAGVVDEHLPAAGVAVNDLFWIAVKGPSLMLTALAAQAYVEGDIVHALTAVTSGATTAGRPFVGATTSPLTMIGIAMSAKTTSQTNTDLLVDLFTMKTI